MYRPISDYALIGDTQTAALVGSDGAIDWLCLPRFDSPAVFLRLLDAGRGGYCSIKPRDLKRTSRRYLGMTAILETSFETGTGRCVLSDFMPVRRRAGAHRTGENTAGEHRLIRLLRCTAGKVEATIGVKPTFRYAAEIPRAIPMDAGLLFEGRDDRLLAQLLPGRLDAAEKSLALHAGESVALVLSYVRSGSDVRPLGQEDVERALEQTRDYWTDWAGRCLYKGRFCDQVMRSAVTLKLLTFEPTGAIIAAPTTSLPEDIGGSRNWDYRYCWLRDSTFTLAALMNLGYFDEAHDFMHFLRSVCECPTAEFQILYGVRGERETPERVLAHLEGYRGSRPVRIGNAAAIQRQLDVYGELVECIYLYERKRGFERFNESFIKEMWVTVKSVADHVVRHWREPDSGIWEVRGPDQHFVHSKAMCWVALDRAVKLARQAGLDHDTARWASERDLILRSVLEEGYDPTIGAFVQAYGSTALDAAALRLPMLGVVPPDDPKMRSTVERIQQRLVRNRLVYRYLSHDGLPGGEGTFAICTFWLINNLAMMGRLEEAEGLFQHVLSFANDVGLFAEEIEPSTGQQLGNFPQAFTHIALINSAVRLDAAREGRPAFEADVGGQRP